MTLRQKTLLIIGVTLLCLLVTLYFNLSTIWLHGFAKIEAQRIHQNVERVTEAVANSLLDLERITGDWAAFDDTYAFIKDRNQKYIQANIADPAVDNLRLNVILFINTAGQTIYAKGFDLEKKVAVPVPDSFNQYLATHPRLLQYTTADSSHTGIVLLPEGVLLFCSYSILNTERTSPSRGTLIFGRFLNATQIEQLSKLTHLSIAIHPIESTQLPRDFQAIKRKFGKEATNSQDQVQQLILVHCLSEKHIAGYTVLRDIEGQPVLFLRVNASRDIYQQGKQGLRYLLISLFAICLIFGIIALVLLEKSVLSPLAYFSSTVKGIHTSGNLSHRLIIRGRDELSHLGTAINQLLITLQQSQLQLYESEERYRSVVNSVREVIFQTEATGTLTFLNSAWTEITGFSIEESLSQPCWKFIHPEDQPHHIEQFHQLIAGKTHDTRYEIRCRTRDGSYRWFEVHAHYTVKSCDTLSKPTVGIVGILGTLNDITQRKLAEAREREKTQELEQTLHKLTQTQAQLIQSEKMSSLGQLVAGVAHEINNPISFVRGNVYYASLYSKDLLRLVHCYQQYYPNPPATLQAELEEIDLAFIVNDLPKLLDSIKVGSERICEIVLSLRNFSRLDEAEIKVVNLHEGIDSTLLILQNRFKAKGKQTEIQLIKEYGDLPLVECYPGQLNQVFMNLITNAIDALEEKEVESEKDITTSSPCIRIRTELKTNNSTNSLTHGKFSGDESDDSRIVIQIADNGAGMSEDVRCRLFDPFFTTKPVGKGTGLGLSISYQIIVEKHKGQLLVNSEPNQGTEFIIELPLQQKSR